MVVPVKMRDPEGGGLGSQTRGGGGRGSRSPGPGVQSLSGQRLSAPRVRSLQRPPPESGPGTKLSMTHGLWLVAWGVGGL